MAMATDYGVADIAVVQSALEQYALQQAVIAKIKATLEEDGILTSKEYVKNRENLYVHPALKELPRHVDSANKTADLVLRMIDRLGKPPAEKGVLSELSKL